MKIAFDYQTFTNQSYGGISRYFVRLAEHLLAADQQVKIFAPLHRNKYLKELANDIVVGKELNRFPPKSAKLFSLWNRISSNPSINNWNPDVIHETYYAAKPSGSSSSLRVITVYDMIHELFPKNFSILDQTARNKKIAIARADKIICISHSTKSDLIKLFNTPEEKISVIHLASEKFPISKSESSSTLNKPYILYVGGRSGYKNFNGFVKAFAASEQIKKNFNIVAFGGGKFSKQEQTLMSALNLNGSQVIHQTGSDALLGSLYAGARAFVYPSLYEGFGLPPLEAMAQGCPVISSNASSMPEVIGDAGIYFSPVNLDEMRIALETTLNSDTLRQDLIQKGYERLTKFSWDKCAQETLRVYSSAINR